jgi:hypothetical protein
MAMVDRRRINEMRNSCSNYVRVTVSRHGINMTFFSAAPSPSKSCSALLCSALLCSMIFHLLVFLYILRAVELKELVGLLGL